MTAARGFEVLVELLAVAAERDRLVEADRLLRDLVGSAAVNAAHRRLTNMWAERLESGTRVPDRPASGSVFELTRRLRAGTARGAV